MVNDPASQTMCTLSLAKLLPLARVQAFFSAFKSVNAEALTRLSRDARAAAAQCTEDGQDKNRQHFMESPLHSWFGSAGELCISNAEGCWQEPCHQDGGASVLHIGITLFGRRRLTCKQPGGEDVWLDNIPGTMYLGGLTGPWHQVSHQPAPPDELLQQSWSVSVMQRTTLFPFTRSRVKDTTPHPVEFFRTIAASFVHSLAAGSWQLPPLELCKEFFEHEASGHTPPSPTHPSAESSIQGNNARITEKPAKDKPPSPPKPRGSKRHKASK
jgi:hypothetical protein